jgi:hypothetical protein
MLSDVIFSGSSDDLIEVEGALSGCDEYDTAGSGRGAFVVHCKGDTSALIALKFAGTWAVAIAPVDEDTPMPEVIVTAEGYTAKALIRDAMVVTRVEA